MYILVALVVLSNTTQDPVILVGKTRFPTEQQCQAQIKPATEALQKQVDNIGAKVADMRCRLTNEQDI